jgi:hypothetical protein
VLRFQAQLPAAEAEQFAKETSSRWFEAAFLDMLDKEGLKLELIVIPPKWPKTAGFFGSSSPPKLQSMRADGDGDGGADGDGSQDDDGNALGGFLFCLIVLVGGSVCTLSSFLMLWSVGDPSGANRVVTQIMSMFDGVSETKPTGRWKKRTSAAQYDGLPTQFCPSPIGSPPGTPVRGDNRQINYDGAGTPRCNNRQSYNGSPPPELQALHSVLHGRTSPQSPRYDGQSRAFEDVQGAVHGAYTQYSSPAHGLQRPHIQRNNDHLISIGGNDHLITKVRLGEMDFGRQQRTGAYPMSENQLDSPDTSPTCSPTSLSRRMSAKGQSNLSVLTV